MTGRRAAATWLGLAAVMLAAVPAMADKPRWDRKANVTEAAERLSKLHKRSGSEGVLKFLDACYRTHALASKFSAAMEGCMAQDYAHSRVLVAIYEKLPDAVRAERKLPSAGAIASAMNARFDSVAGQYGLKQDEIKAMKDDFEAHAVPVFLKSAFPQGGGEAKPK